MNPLATFLLAAALQQGTYTVAKEGLHMSKTEALIFSAVLTGTGITLYEMMDQTDTHIMLRQAAYGWAGMGLAIGTTIAIPGL